MAVSLTRFSLWLWSGKEKNSVSNGSSLSSSADWSSGFRDHDSIKLPRKKLSSSKKKLQSKEERRGDKQFDAASESDGPEWSIGWVEPHGIGFRNDDESDDGFAVLVPCYRSGCKELLENSNNQLLSAIKNMPNEFSSGGNKCMEVAFFSGEFLN
ncbi:uncharacterized protein [Euphorbia lathyris]|uniref:uncharacterized protein n=1 Tax=Euphorbia lathyris TaxID=212925 RepID=UPI0033139D85